MNVRFLVLLTLYAMILVTCSAQQNTRWQALGTGLYSALPYINTISVIGTDVYVGGIIQQAGGKPVRNIARWSWADGNWYALGEGANSNVYATLPIVRGGDTVLLVGGSFEQVGTVLCQGVAMWNPRQARWECLIDSLGGGMEKRVVNFLKDGNFLYICGTFSSIGGISASGLVRYDLQSGQLAALGAFEQREDTTFGPPHVQSVVRIGNSLYAVGFFTHVNSIRSVGIARYDLATGKWDSVPGSHFVLNDYNAVLPDAAVSVGDSLIIGGEFEWFGTMQARGLLVYDTRTQQWSEFAGGVWRDTSTSLIKYYAVFALAYDGGHLYVGGSFDQAGTILASNIAHYDFSKKQWEALESGTRGRVLSLTLTPQRLYVGGGFPTAGGIRVNYIAAWLRDTTTSWVPDASEGSPLSIAAGTVHYRTASSGPAQLTLFDLRGRLIATLAGGWHDAGTHCIALPSLPAGVYLLQFRARGISTSQAVIIEP